MCYFKLLSDAEHQVDLQEKAKKPLSTHEYMVLSMHLLLAANPMLVPLNKFRSTHDTYHGHVFLPCRLSFMHNGLEVMFCRLAAQPVMYSKSQV